MAEKRVIEYEAASAVENDDWLLLDGVTEGTRKIRPSVMNGDITSAITTLQGDVGDLADNFAEEYDSSESYTVGDYCTHENILYICTGATTGTWDGTKWTSTDVAEIAENSGKVNDVQVNGTSVVTNKVASIDLTGMQADIDSKQADTKIGGVSILDNNKVANLDFLASYGEASGSIASFNDGAAMPLKSLKVGIEAVQSGSGDPSPTNVRPFSGWGAVNGYRTGINVWDEEWRIDGGQFKAKNLIPVKPNTSYYFKRPLSAYSAFKYDINGTSLGTIFLPENAVFTTDSETYYIWFSLSVSDYGTTYNNDISINYPSTDTDYHAYNGTTYTTQLKDGQGNPLVCYGGQLVNENGVQRLGNQYGYIEFDGSSDEEWTINNNCHCIYVANIKQSTTQSTTNFITIANEYKSVGVRYRDDITEGGIAKTIGANNQIAIRDTNYSTNDSWREFLASKPLQVCYELATPIIISQDSLSIATQEGVNNIWADSGDILECKYVRDNSAVINDLIARVTALENE